MILFLIGAVTALFGQSSTQKTFATPEEAARALYQATANQDEAEIAVILGDTETVSSGNTEQDKAERVQFSNKYKEMHRLVRDLDGSVELYVGAENWPFPFPLVSQNGKWYFNSQEGTQEVLFRTIGEGEAEAIGICRALASGKADESSGANGEIALSAQAAAVE